MSCRLSRMPCQNLKSVTNRYNHSQPILHTSNFFTESRNLIACSKSKYQRLLVPHPLFDDEIQDLRLCQAVPDRSIAPFFGAVSHKNNTTNKIIGSPKIIRSIRNMSNSFIHSHLLVECRTLRCSR